MINETSGIRNQTLMVNLSKIRNFFDNLNRDSGVSDFLYVKDCLMFEQGKFQRTVLQILGTPDVIISIHS